MNYDINDLNFEVRKLTASLSQMIKWFCSCFRISRASAPSGRSSTSNSMTSSLSFNGISIFPGIFLDCQQWQKYKKHRRPNQRWNPNTDLQTIVLIKHRKQSNREHTFKAKSSVGKHRQFQFKFCFGWKTLKRSILFIRFYLTKYLIGAQRLYTTFALYALHTMRLRDMSSLESCEHSTQVSSKNDTKSWSYNLINIQMNFFQRKKNLLI